MKANNDKVPLSPSEWYFLDCPEDEMLLCAYYEYARSSPTMIKAIQHVHNDVYIAVTEAPKPKYVAFQTERFPTTPWLEIPWKERRRIAEWINENLPPNDLVYRKHPRLLSEEFSPEDEFEEEGPCVATTMRRTTALIRVHWDLSNAELKEAFQRFLTKYRPPGTGPNRGRGKSKPDYLNALGAKRLLDHYAHVGNGHVAAMAFEAMETQVGKSKGLLRQEYGSASALTNAAQRAPKYLLDLYQIPIDRRLKENQAMTEEEMEMFGPDKPWFPGIYLEDPADFG